MKSRLKLLNTRQSSAGFTLIELLVAAAISMIVISVAGFGLVTIMGANQKAEAETERRTNLNRALDFIADDARMANNISLASSYTISSPEPSCDLTTIATPVLKLTIGTGGSANNIVYYLNNINGCSSSTWIKPGVIKRVQNVSSTTIAGSSGSELVDALVAPTTALPACATTLQGTGGFYACIENSRTVTLYLYGKDVNGKALPPVRTRVFARTAP